MKTVLFPAPRTYWGASTPNFCNTDTGRKRAVVVMTKNEVSAPVVAETVVNIKGAAKKQKMALKKIIPNTV